MEVINKPYYKCDFCGKKQFRKCDMSLHEKWCKNNPKNKHTCFQFCQHLIKGEEEYEGQSKYEDGTFVGKRTTFYCDILKQNMYSFIAERKKLPIVNKPDAIRMPLECDKFNDGASNFDDFLNF